MSIPVKRRRVVCSFGGGGGGAMGFQRARAAFNGERAEFDLVGGFDKDEYAVRVFEYLTGVAQVCIDAREMTPGMMREFYGEKAPFAFFGSPPCVGYSKLLSAAKSKTAKYKLTNELALVNTNLILETWPDDLPAFILYENVPNITSRGAALLVKIRGVLRAAGYVLQDGFQECRHTGDLAQRRKRWFLVARNPRKIPAFLYLPPHRPGKVCSDVLDELPMPGDPAGGPMHELPAISALNWWRLWAIPAGGDWRDLLPQDGTPRRARFRRHHIEQWSEPSVTIGGSGSNGPCGIADPRQERFHHVDKVTAWDAAAGTVTHAQAPSSGAISVADPRSVLAMTINPATPGNHYTIAGQCDVAPSVTTATRPGNGAVSYAAPTPLDLVPEKKCFDAGYAVIDRERQPSLAIAATSQVGCGTYSITDRVPAPLDLALGCAPHAGAYGVIADVSPTVIAASKIDNNTSAIAVAVQAAPPFVILSYQQAKLVADGHVVAPFAIVDPARPDEPLAIVEDMAKPPHRWIKTVGRLGKRKRKKMVVPLVLISEDGTWHRPLTTLELAVLQGLPWRLRGAPLDFGSGSTEQRRVVGNMVPMPVGTAIADQMLLAGLASDQGCCFLFGGGGGLWVRPEQRAALERAGVRSVRQEDVANVRADEAVLLDDAAKPVRRRAARRGGAAVRPRGLTVERALAVLRATESAQAMSLH